MTQSIGNPAFLAQNFPELIRKASFWMRKRSFEPDVYSKREWYILQMISGIESNCKSPLEAIKEKFAGQYSEYKVEIDQLVQKILPSGLNQTTQPSKGSISSLRKERRDLDQKKEILPDLYKKQNEEEEDAFIQMTGEGSPSDRDTTCRTRGRSNSFFFCNEPCQLNNSGYSTESTNSFSEEEDSFRKKSSDSDDSESSSTLSPFFINPEKGRKRVQRQGLMRSKSAIYLPKKISSRRNLDKSASFSGRLATVSDSTQIKDLVNSELLHTLMLSIVCKKYLFSRIYRNFSKNQKKWTDLIQKYYLVKKTKQVTIKNPYEFCFQNLKEEHRIELIKTIDFIKNDNKCVKADKNNATSVPEFFAKHFSEERFNELAEQALHYRFTYLAIFSTLTPIQKKMIDVILEIGLIREFLHFPLQQAVCTHGYNFEETEFLKLCKILDSGNMKNTQPDGNVSFIEIQRQLTEQQKQLEGLQEQPNQQQLIELKRSLGELQGQLEVLNHQKQLSELIVFQNRHCLDLFLSHLEEYSFKGDNKKQFLKQQLKIVGEKIKEGLSISEALEIGLGIPVIKKIYQIESTLSVVEHMQAVIRFIKDIVFTPVKHFALDDRETFLEYVTCIPKEENALSVVQKIFKEMNTFLQKNPEIEMKYVVLFFLNQHKKKKKMNSAHQINNAKEICKELNKLGKILEENQGKTKTVDT